MIKPIDLDSFRNQGPLEIRCLKCKRRLAQTVQVLGDDIKLRGENDEPVLPEQSITSASRLIKELGERTGVTSDGIIANRVDLIGAVDGGTRNGCCGPDGMDGPNLICSAGHKVGTEFGDCWMPHFVFLNAQWIELCPLKWGVKGPDEK